MFQIISTISHKNNNTFALTMEQAEQNIIKIYLSNEMGIFYSINDKEYNFDYEKLLLLKEVNQFIIDKKYSKACELILKSFSQLSIVDLNNFTPPKPLDQKEIEQAVKTCVFDGFNDNKTKRKVNKSHRLAKFN